MKSDTPVEIWAVKLAAKWAGTLGLPPGNFWEPGIAMNLRRLTEEGYSRQDAEIGLAERLGLLLPREDL